MFTLTPAAAAQIRKAAADSGAAEMALRVAAQRDTDGAIAYGMGFDELREGDMPLEMEGIRLLIAPPSQPLLQGTQLDFVELEPGSFNFIFIAGQPTAHEPPRRGCGGGGCSSCAS
jgi:iron-sulfur cluster assembly protein